MQPELIKFHPHQLHGLKYVHGEERGSNKVIISVVDRLLTEKDQIRVLEIGAGGCFGATDHFLGIDFSVPDLSRKFAENPRIKIIATDIEPETITSVKDGVLHVHALVANVFEGNALPPTVMKVEIPSKLEYLFQNIREDGTLLLAQPETQVLYDCIIRDRKSLRSTLLPEAPLIFMPPVFKDYEKKKFGLEVRGGVACDQLVDGGNFDLVFGRHLNPSFYTGNSEKLKANPQLLLDALKVNLRPGGIVIVEIDHDARRSLPKIYTDMK